MRQREERTMKKAAACLVPLAMDDGVERYGDETPSSSDGSRLVAR
jgi:hypothetical protein